MAFQRPPGPEERFAGGQRCFHALLEESEQVESLRRAAVQGQTAQDQGAEAFGSEAGDAPAYLSPHGIAKEVGLVYAEVIQYGDDVGHSRGHLVGPRVVRLVAEAVPPGVHQDELVVILEPLSPARDAPQPLAPTQPVV